MSGPAGGGIPGDRGDSVFAFQPEPVSHLGCGRHLQHRHGAAFCRLGAVLQVVHHALHVSIAGGDFTQGLLYGGLARATVGYGVHHFHLHAGMRVTGHSMENFGGIGQTVGLEAQHSHRSSPVQGGRGFQQLREQRGTCLAETLRDEDRFQCGLVELRTLAVKRGDPLFQGRQRLRSRLPEFDANVMPHDVLRMEQQCEQFWNCAAFDARVFLHHRLRIVHRAPDPTMIVIPVRIPHRVLRVADDGTAEV